jgi:2'-5' RNA ligase
VFFGFEPDPDCKRAIADWRDRYGRADGRPVPPGNFHVTLAFVGAIDDVPLERLCLAVEECLNHARRQPDILELDCVGFWARPAIFWLGASTVPPALSLLAGELQRRATAAGARREAESWVPHVTLYRKCHEPPPAPLKAPSITLHCRNVTLFESLPGRSGVSYEPIAEWPLTPSAGS